MRRFSTLELHWMQKPQRHFTFIPESPWLGFLSTPASMRFSVVPKDTWRLISCCSMNVCFHVHNEGCLSPASGLLLEANPEFKKVYSLYRQYLLFVILTTSLSFDDPVTCSSGEISRLFLFFCLFQSWNCWMRPVLSPSSYEAIRTDYSCRFHRACRLLLSSLRRKHTHTRASTHTRTYAYN